jgi:predicted dehydrogenase
MVSFSAVSAPLRFTQGFEAVTALLPQAGRIVEVEVACQSWLPDWRPNTDYRASYSADPNEGGVLRDLVHEIDYTLKLFGFPESVSAVLEHSKELEIEAEASAVLTWQYPNFVLTMTLDYTSPVARRYIAIHGESATITWNALEGCVKMHESDDAETQVLRFPQDLSKDGVLVLQLEALVSPGTHPQLCTFQDAIRAVALCDAARESDEASVPTILSGPPWERL